MAYYGNCNLKELAGLFDSFAASTEDDESMDVMRDVMRTSSHTLRAAVFDLAARANLGEQSRMALYLLVVICEERHRLLLSFELFPEALRSSEILKAAMQFIENYTVASVNAEELSRNIALVHIANSNPCACLFWWKVMTKPAERTVEAFLATRFATQIRLSADLIELNKGEMRVFWDGIRETGNNRIRMDSTAGFDEECFATAAADGYPLLVILANGYLVTWKGGAVYNRNDVEEWLKFPVRHDKIRPDTYNPDDIFELHNNETSHQDSTNRRQEKA